MLSMDNVCLCYLMAGIVGLLFQKHQMIQAWKYEDKEHIRGNSNPMWCVWQSCCEKKQRYVAFFFSLKSFMYSNSQQCLGLDILIFFNNFFWCRRFQLEESQVRIRQKPHTKYKKQIRKPRLKANKKAPKLIRQQKTSAIVKMVMITDFGFLNYKYYLIKSKMCLLFNIF